jgi:PAS domain S-box-containing protein
VTPESDTRVVIEGRTVLVVEDELAVALSEKMILEDYGFRVLVASTGEDAVSLVEKTPEIDLVLMDINLGAGIDGTKAAEQILALRELPLIFLSSHTEREVVDKTEGITCYGYVVKNSGETVLLASIRMAFRLSDARCNERESERARLESEAKFRNIVQSTPMGIHMYRLEEDGRLVFTGANRAADDILGVENSRFVSMTIEEAFPGLVGTEVPDRYRQAAKDGMPWNTLQIDYQHGAIAGAFEVHAFQTEPGSMVAMFTDITERKRADEALRISEDRFRHLFDRIPIGIGITDADGQMEANGAFYRMLGRSPKDGPLRWSEIVHPDDLRAQTEIIDAILRGEEASAHCVRRFCHKNGTTVWAELDTLARRSESKALMYVITAAVNVTDREAARQALAESEQLAAAISDSVPVLVYVYDLAKHCNVWVNSRHREFLGREVTTDPAELSVDDMVALVHPDDMPLFFDGLDRIVSGNAKGDVQVEARFRQGDKWVWMLHRASVFERDAGGSAVKIIGSLVDISDRKAAEVEVEQANRNLEALVGERDLLLREMNHRIKNNLFVVKSLLDLREAAHDVDLTNVKNQVVSISLVHELLNDSHDFRGVHAREYVDAILQSVFAGLQGDDVEVESDIEDIDLPSQTAVPVGLIVNEVATNALRHGRLPGEPFRFAARLHRDADTGTWELAMHNTGRPLPEGIDLEKPKTLGLQLISALTHQLRGTLEIQRSPRTAITLRFPCYERA